MPSTADMFRVQHDRFGVVLNNGYGLSETGIIIFNGDAEAALAGPVIGVPNRGIEIRLLDLWGGDREDPDEGEIAVRSDTIADRYFLQGANAVPTVKLVGLA